MRCSHTTLTNRWRRRTKMNSPWRKKKTRVSGSVNKRNSSILSANTRLLGFFFLLAYRHLLDTHSACPLGLSWVSKSHRHLRGLCNIHHSCSVADWREVAKVRALWLEERVIFSQKPVCFTYNGFTEKPRSSHRGSATRTTRDHGGGRRPEAGQRHAVRSWSVSDAHGAPPPNIQL